METNQLPLFVAGPMLRRVTADTVVIWAVVTEAIQGKVQICHKLSPSPLKRKSNHRGHPTGR
ncbi:hypothetical protein [Veronia pacifica]|uniref:hypothetical protein n=1 Tax=Veronia pacifica TaxID=1080227 RepID=UPI001FE059DD|nr:hypothetical protein [Veronia pacifica]